ncbi:MAG: TolC family protein [Isosphaeraceae bacterium]
MQLWAAEKAVELAREIVNREQAELVVGKGTVADVAEAVQRYEQFNLDLVTRTSDVITTERQLRNILGLEPADNRRIIPVTPPTEARLPARLGFQPRPDDHVPARHRAAAAPGGSRSSSSWWRGTSSCRS